MIAEAAPPVADRRIPLGRIGLGVALAGSVLLLLLGGGQFLSSAVLKGRVERALSARAGGWARVDRAGLLLPLGFEAQGVRLCGRRVCGRIHRIEVVPSWAGPLRVRLLGGELEVRDMGTGSGGPGTAGPEVRRSRWSLVAHGIRVRLPGRRLVLRVDEAEADRGSWRARGRARMGLGAFGALEASWRVEGHGPWNSDGVDILAMGKMRLTLGRAAGPLAGTVWEGRSRVEQLAPGLYRLRLAAAGPSGGPLWLDVIWDRERDKRLVSFRFQEVSVAGTWELPGGVHILGLGGSAEGRVELNGQAGRGWVRLALEGRLRTRAGLVASRPIEWPEARLSGRVAFSWSDSDHWTVETAGLGLALARVRARVAGRLRRGGSRLRAGVRVRIPATDCQAFLAALPEAFVPKLRGMRLAGRLGGTIRLGLDTRHWDRLVLSASWREAGCRVLSDPEGADVHRLLGAVDLDLPDGQAGRVRWHLGPGNRWYVPLRRLPGHLVRAFLLTEDQNFFEHHGFDWAQIRRALAYDLERGQALKGASSISQQLVKNVFLTHERTLSRKVQEAVLTWRLEQVVPKRRILELYLNLVEMAPGIYGVARGARLYFGKSIQRLTALESLHLAAVTPAPGTYFQRFSRGWTGAAWVARLHGLLRRMRHRGWVSEPVYQASLSRPLLLSWAVRRHARRLARLLASKTAGFAGK